MIGQELIRPAVARDAEGVGLLLTSHGLPAEFVVTEFLVAERNAIVVGCARLRRVREGGSEISDLVVDPTHRGGGLGRDLLMALLERARYPAYTLTDHPVFAERFGFEPVPEDQLPESLLSRAGSFEDHGHPVWAMRLTHDRPSPLILPREPFTELLDL